MCKPANSRSRIYASRSEVGVSSRDRGTSDPRGREPVRRRRPDNEHDERDRLITAKSATSPRTIRRWGTTRSGTSPRARRWVSTLGRFISPDTLISGSDTIGRNQYDYGDNDPINEKDVNGKCATPALTVGGGKDRRRRAADTRRRAAKERVTRRLVERSGARPIQRGSSRAVHRLLRAAPRATAKVPQGRIPIGYLRGVVISRETERR